MSLYPQLPQYQSAVANALRCDPRTTLGYECVPFSVGGISEAWYTGKDFVLNCFFGTTGEVSEIQAPTAIWYPMFIRRNSGTLTAKTVNSRAGRFTEQTFSGVFDGLLHKERNQLFNILNTDLVILTVDRSGKVWLFGWPFGARLVQADFSAGANRAEAQTSTFSFSSNNKRRFPVVLPAAFAALNFSEADVCNQNYQTNFPISGNCIIDGSQII